MKGLTLRQPWATLVAIGAKRIETRCWNTDYRGPLAIHASTIYRKAEERVALSSPFIEKLNAAGYLPDIPLGCIVAICKLVDCLPMEPHVCLPGIFDEYPKLNTSIERAFGNYEVIDSKNHRRRWAFVLEDVKPIEPPIRATGCLGLWESEVLAKLNCQVLRKEMGE